MKPKNKWIVVGAITVVVILAASCSKHTGNTFQTETPRGNKTEALGNTPNQKAEDAAYKREVEGHLSTLKAVVEDTKISLERDELPQKKRAHMQKMVSEYGTHLKEYQKRYETEDYNSLKELFEEALDASRQIQESLD